MHDLQFDIQHTAVSEPQNMQAGIGDAKETPLKTVIG
jgi:hypothetical protein